VRDVSATSGDERSSVSHVGFDRFTLFDFGFDDGQFRLLTRHQCSEFPVRHLNIRMGLDLCAILVKSEGIQLGDLVLRQAETRLIS
jgi:hypothetical protein